MTGCMWSKKHTGQAYGEVGAGLRMLACVNPRQGGAGGMHASRAALAIRSTSSNCPALQSRSSQPQTPTPAMCCCILAVYDAHGQPAQVGRSMAPVGPPTPHRTGPLTLPQPYTCSCSECHQSQQQHKLPQPHPSINVRNTHSLHCSTSAFNPIKASTHET